MNEAKAKILAYLSGADKHAYFVAVDGAEYVELKNFFRDLASIRLSNFCRGDVFPDSDEFIEAARTLSGNALVLGVGESAALSGNYRLINRLRSLTFQKKLVVLCRGVKNFLLRLVTENPKFRKNLSVVESSGSFSVTQYLPNLGIKTATKNFRELLCVLEDGTTGAVEVNSELSLEKVFRVATAYDAIKLREPELRAPRTALNENQWRNVLIGDKTWARYLRGFSEGFANKYEQFAFEQSANFDEFERNIFDALLKIKPDSREFTELYELRKVLVAGNEKFLPGYIDAAKAFGADGIYYLTDNTLLEFRAAMELAASASNRSVLEKNFPTVRKYLTVFDFGDERLTEYFRLYKELKLFNVVSKEFLSQVEKFSATRIYNELETRQAILERTGAGKLYWLDGLSVDFLGYIKSRLFEMGFRSKIQTARAELPTLTSINKDFYAEWPWEKFPKNERLDKLRHETQKVSVYFCDEIFIIEDMLKEISAALKSGETSKVILTSDHGSSRGAVICRGQTIKLQASGEHGGRCCKVDERDAKPICAVESNGYFSLTNYDRIQGGRLEGVEMHGGATLEEVLVPVIEIFA